MNLSDAPEKLVLPWANAGSKNDPIPVPSQIGITPGAASWTDGFPPLCDTPLLSGGIPPSMQDVNGGLYQMSAVDRWACAGAGFPYDAAFSAAVGGYPKGARVLKAGGGSYWISTVDNNVTNPDTGGAGWASDGTGGITALTGDVTATGPGIVAATLAASGVTAGSYTQANVTIDAKGRVTSASNGTGGITALTGDVSATGPGSAAATLAASGVTAGSYTQANLTIDAKGRVTAAETGTPSFTGTLGYQILSSGLILQWGGTVQFDTGPVTVPFSAPFPHACLMVQITNNYDVSGPTTHIWTVGEFTTTGFLARNNGSNAGYWFAIGY